jgi:predicted secreted hydrolase
MTRRQWLAATTFLKAVPGWRYEFPRDHFSHPAFRTEWWYYTGNVGDAQGRPFGFELTFFRAALAESVERRNVWSTRDAYMAHLALTDIAGKAFYHSERLNRPGPGLAGVDADQGRIWNGNWESLVQPESHRLRAVAEKFSFALDLAVAKPPVIHGRGGVSQKGPLAGQASHYISFTRLEAGGEIVLGAERFRVRGTAWMDHEFFSSELDEKLAGWDWFSIQLDNREELMLYRLRQKDGSSSPWSAGSYVRADGRIEHLEAADLELEPGRKWKNYPVAWRVRVKRLGIDLLAEPRLDSQELLSKAKLTPSYWEGAMVFRGSHHGVGYLEMTGYDDRVLFTRREGVRK